ncbi:hypothetical protein [Solemya velum gill symbiont]|uniref:hypothetical protein n=1 Tax=Solemya velum gill symbiont TaxID=2340 RepID=UPI00117A0A3A|nr:hypothetical protein [Solemya velum gill symbiont]
MEITEQQEKQLRQATEDFSIAMEIRNAMTIRVAKRVTAILRVEMVSLSIVTIILLLMLYAFTSKMGAMIDALATMDTQFSSMSGDMTKMRTTMHNMQRNIAHVPAITQATVDISNSVSNMNGEVGGMNLTIASLNYKVYGITNHVSNMNQEFRSIDPAVQQIGRDVYRANGPMRLMNDMNPFD